MANDLLTTVALATRAVLVVAPAMNVHMFRHATVQRNLKELRAAGAHIVDPGEGEMACGHEGEGRLADIEDVMDVASRALAPQDLSGVGFLVTAGPTAEPLDPVRVLSNRSSGKMGYALARSAWRRGADTTLVSGPVDCSLRAPRGVTVVPVRTADEMHRAVLERFPKASVVVMAAAVADWRPKTVAVSKIKTREGDLPLELTRTQDILAQLGREKGERILVGFAAETDRVLENARGKLERKNLDLIVANDVTAEGAGFGADTNRITIIDRDGHEEALPLLSKDRAADVVIDRVARRLLQDSSSAIKPAHTHARRGS